MPRIIKPVSKGDIAVPTIQVDSSGRIFSASAGSAGGGCYAPTHFITSGSGNITTTGNTSKLLVYLQGPGGGGGGVALNNPGKAGGTGGIGGYSLSVHEVSSSQTIAYDMGTGGNEGNSANPANAGNAGNTANFASPAIITANSGNGGEGSKHVGAENRAGNPGNPGTASVNSGTQTLTNYSPASFYGIDTSDNGGNSSATGQTGRLYIWEDV